MSKLTTTWWIIFYKDQLLLKKTDNGFSIPCAGQPPIHISPETNIHEICMLDGHPCKAIAIDYPVEESDKYMMTGLRFHSTEAISDCRKSSRNTTLGSQ